MTDHEAILMLVGELRPKIPWANWDAAEHQMRSFMGDAQRRGDPAIGIVIGTAYARITRWVVQFPTQDLVRDHGGPPIPKGTANRITMRLIRESGSCKLVDLSEVTGAWVATANGMLLVAKPIGGVAQA